MFPSRLQTREDYLSGPSSGTTAEAVFKGGEDRELIKIESVAMFAGKKLFLRAAPSENPEVQENRHRVLDSLERSLEENADVWAELSKY